MDGLLKYLQKENYFRVFSPIFRVFLCFHIIKKIYLNHTSTSLFFGNDLIEIKSSLYNSFEWLFTTQVFEVPILFVFFVIVCVLYALGIGRWFTALLVFIGFYLYNDASSLNGNGGDNYLYFILIYMIFINSYSYLCLKKSESTKSNHLVSNLAGYSIILHLCLIYFVSALHKIHADVWFNGVATYYILNLERYTSPFNHYFSKNAFIIIFSTYFTILFELLFPILIWVKKLRVPFMISGIGLHLGIYFFMMIYDFEILFIVVYGFILTNAEWEKVVHKLSDFTFFQKINFFKGAQ